MEAAIVSWRYGYMLVAPLQVRQQNSGRTKYCKQWGQESPEFRHVYSLLQLLNQYVLACILFAFWYSMQRFTEKSSRSAFMHGIAQIVRFPRNSIIPRDWARSRGRNNFEFKRTASSRKAFSPSLWLTLCLRNYATF